MRRLAWLGGWMLLAGCSAETSQIAALPGDASTASEVVVRTVDAGTAPDVPVVDVPSVDVGLSMDGATGDGAAGDGAEGDGGAVVDDASTSVCLGLDVSSPPGCNPTTRWPVMLAAPIVPPYSAAGLNLDIAPGTGIPVSTADQINCGGTLSAGFPGGVVGWGANTEVWMGLDPTTCRGTQITLWPGYTGTMTFSDAAHTHQYVVLVNSQITRDGLPFTLDWSDPVLAPQEFDALNRAVNATFVPSATPDPVGMTCIATGSCVSGNFGDVAYIYFHPSHMALWVASVSAPQPVPSIPNRVDLDLGP